MSNPEDRDLANPQQRLVVRCKIDGVWSQKYYGEVGATWTVDATTQFRPGIASLPYLWTIEVTGDDQITVKAGSLDHNGQTYTWPDTTFTADGSGNYQVDNLVNGIGGTVIVYNFNESPIVFHTQVYMPQLAGVAPDGHNPDLMPDNAYELGLSEGPATEEGAATGSGSGDPFITPIF